MYIMGHRDASSIFWYFPFFSLNFSRMHLQAAEPRGGHLLSRDRGEEQGKSEGDPEIYRGEEKQKKLRASCRYNFTVKKVARKS